MKLDPDQYDFSNRLKRVKVKDPAVAKTLAQIAKGEKHMVRHRREVYRRG